jgi:hypothetical protein
MTITELDDPMLLIIAYDLLSRDDIADLRATRDAIELADLLISIMPSRYDDTLIYDEPLYELRTIMTDMILNPLD